MRVDESWHDDRVGGIDDLGVTSPDTLPDLGYQIVLDEHIGLPEVADLSVQAEHTAAHEQGPTHHSALNPLIMPMNSDTTHSAPRFLSDWGHVFSVA